MLKIFAPSLIFVLFLLFFSSRMRAKGLSWKLHPSRSLDIIRLPEYARIYWGWLKYFLGLGPYFILPDIVSPCKYPVAYNPHYKEQIKASLQWTAELGNQDENKRKYFANTRLGELSAIAYPTANAFRLRVCIDWMNCIFEIDDLLEELDVEGNRKMEELCMAAMRDPANFTGTLPGAIMTQSWCARLEKSSSIACKERMMGAMAKFFQGTREHAAYREKGYIPTIEEFTAIRRCNIGGWPVLVLIEYAGGYLLPDHIYNHPIIRTLQLATIDHICHVNDLISYNIEQARGETHNLITIGMKMKGWTIQEAVDFVGKRCNECIDRLESGRLLLPSWGPEIDELVSEYVKGLQIWMAANLHWSFMTARYVGKEGMDITKDRVIKLYPKSARMVF